ncbi:MAG TPA: OmpA family protein, partial [Candidatus Eisenbacteria bacterium]|nr:OmpA family protein [Candidatus Eisenbacteria bacterium]
MHSDLQRIQAEAEAFKQGEEAAFALEASQSLSSQAQSEKDKELAAAMLDEAQASAFASVAASMTQRAAVEADSLRRAAAEAERQWQDTIRMLEQTEKVSEREAKGIIRTPVPEPEGIELPPMPSPVADTTASSVSLLDQASRWSETARRLSLPTADAYGRFLDALHRAQAPKVDEVVGNREMRAAQWTVSEIAHRAHTEALRQQGQAQLARALALADQRDQALWAMADLERSMKESVRTQLEQERARLADREQELYKSLKQFEGQFATIRQEARGTIMSLSDILFDFGKANLRHEAQLNLAKVSVILQQYPEMQISVEGHTDNVGSEEYNLKLSEQRAKSVYDFLIHEGVAQARLETKGLGMAQPVAPNETAEGRQKNRRVDLVIRGE